MAKKLPPVHPGEILLEDFLKPLGLGQYRVAKSLSVPPRRIKIERPLRALTSASRTRRSRSGPAMAVAAAIWHNPSAHARADACPAVRRPPAWPLTVAQSGGAPARVGDTYPGRAAVHA
jgi:hypothetical protein